MTARICPAMLLSAPASNQGKTVITAAIAAFHRLMGRRVRVFKTGPDFLDPMILESASGNPVYNLDLWMMGEDVCRSLLYEAAGEADIILIEGAMGLFDGDPSTADVASLFKIPVVVIFDCKGMAETLGALSYGLVNYRTDVEFLGVVANNVGSTRHEQMLRRLPPKAPPILAVAKRDLNFELPRRHLGLVQAGEVTTLQAKLESAAETIQQLGLGLLPPPVAFSPTESPRQSRRLEGLSVAVARDEAFSFLYHDNLKVLQELGADVQFFSPLHDDQLPGCDSVYLPGGYPELHADALSKNLQIIQGLRAHHAQGRPIFAECGGMLYLLDSLTDGNGTNFPLTGLIAGKASLNNRLSGLGYQELHWNGMLARGHTFHYSTADWESAPAEHAVKRSDGSAGEAIFYDGCIFASYLHLYFRSCPELIAHLLSSRVHPKIAASGAPTNVHTDACVQEEHLPAHRH